MHFLFDARLHFGNSQHYLLRVPFSFLVLLGILCSARCFKPKTFSAFIWNTHFPNCCSIDKIKILMCKSIVLFFELVSQNYLFHVPLRIMWLESNVHVMYIVFLLLSVFNIFPFFCRMERSMNLNMSWDRWHITVCSMVMIFLSDKYPDSAHILSQPVS